LLLAKRNAEDTRKNALITARSGAKTGLLSNLSTLLGLVPSGGGGGYGSGGGSGGGGGGSGDLTQGVEWTPAMLNTRDQGIRMEGMMGGMGASGTTVKPASDVTGTGSISYSNSGANAGPPSSGFRRAPGYGSTYGPGTPYKTLSDYNKAIKNEKTNQIFSSGKFGQYSSQK
jgi:hypothetical protein